MACLHRTTRLVALVIVLIGAHEINAADWSQWRGANRDGKAPDFNAPATWPSQLKQQWRATVGAGDATPALVGDKVYLFARQGSDEVTVCLDAGIGKELWRDKYPTVSVSGPAGSHPGPRSSPAVADGKVITLGVAGVLSCLDADTGKVIWRKESAKEFSPAYPNFFVASSPLVTDGLCIAHLGGRGSGAVVAFDLAAGTQKWKWDGEGPAYASPELMEAGGIRQVVELGEKTVFGLALADGKLLWQSAVSTGGPGGGPAPNGPGANGPGMRGGPGRPGGPGGRGRGPNNNASTPLVDGSTVIVAGQGVRAISVTQQGGAFSVQPLWTNADVSTSFNSPVLKDGMIFGLSNGNSYFCLDSKTGKQLWATESPAGGGGRGPRGFGSIVDAGSVLLALDPTGSMTILKPDAAKFNSLATIKVADTPTYAYPVVYGPHILIKDQDAVTMFTLDR